ncbi:Ribonuclease Y [hydrothermal vent metagenome]|uniref:Ribonuclease Y n=1 Tax=hydrothermal vent metagenome TaxID=652676 RepID=A0A3B1BUA9_9ZZZZ
METGILALVAVIIGVGAGFFLNKTYTNRKSAKFMVQADQIITQAQKEADTIRKEAELIAKEQILKSRSEFDENVQERKREIESLERRLLDRERILDKKIGHTDRREDEINNRDKVLSERSARISEKEKETDLIFHTQTQKLEEIANLTEEEARRELKEGLFDDARLESANAVKKIEEKAKEEASERAQMVIAQAIQRCASDYVAENTVSVVDLPNDEMKGRIIGREGRNIRALEVATGVDLIIDDTPNAVIISCFDPVKREVARLTLQRLINDGRIHPGRIEDTVAKVSKEIENQLNEEGEKSCFELGLDGIHKEIVRLLGRLKYRTSYSQNVLQHSIEVGFLAGMMAAELGQNVKLARRAGLLHDIGKALDQNMEGSHVQIGMDLGRRYNEPEVVLNSIGSHHEDEPATSVIAVLVGAADTFSASRPGARREMLQNYINRMQKLEEIGDSFAGVEKTYAIQAGREVRVVVEPDTIKDNEAFFLAKDIAKKIEGELVYPGEIKVTVIRETRITDFAK